MAEIRQTFEARPEGLVATASRTALVDAMVAEAWKAELVRSPSLRRGVALIAVGGYGRGQLHPFSDVDLLFAVEKVPARETQDAIRRVSQALWDSGLRVATTTRQPSDCDHLEAGNAEFALALLDARPVTGDLDTAAALGKKALPRLLARDRKRLLRELAGLTQARHERYGDTLFHLEPNVKDCPGGLRDAHVSAWLARLREDTPGQAVEDQEFGRALAFLTSARCFLHFRHERDDNVLDWQAQDVAAERAVGLEGASSGVYRVGAAHWMRVYFRHARTVERRLQREAERSGIRLEYAGQAVARRSPMFSALKRKGDLLELPISAQGQEDPAGEASAVLNLFTSMAQTGAKLGAASETRISDAIPRLSSGLPEGEELWRVFNPILRGRRAGVALRTMHALGLLELILPEFHGIDALVIRDAYHRYTVDEHTFVLIDTLHDLESQSMPGASEWQGRFGGIFAELEHPELLLLGALLHDTGKARAGDNHALESALLAEKVLARFAMDSFGTSMVLQLIETHLEMSAALRRDIFDVETVRAFASKVQTHESLRMLTLFTYADIAAVHPDALTPWKAENLWRLSMATSNQLDRHVDDERFSRQGGHGEGVSRVLAMALGRQDGVSKELIEAFLDGLPERYLRTRAPEVILDHAAMAARCVADPIQIAFHPGEETSEITLVTYDRPLLFADCASVLTAWGMNVVTADAFSNASGVVVDSFRFTDTFQTLALNAEERSRFVESVRDLLAGRASLERLLAGRRRIRRSTPRLLVETSIEFDQTASSHSTLLQVVAQDVPGLLRAISLGLAHIGCNVEVALVDTEGETAIDVFYITRKGAKLNHTLQKELRAELITFIEENLQVSGRETSPKGS